MKNLLDKFFLRSNNLDHISKNIKNLSSNTPISKIFDAIDSYSSSSEIRYVGGCIRKIINKEKIDDIDLATNLEPIQVCEVLSQNKINFHETGINHGTITALIDNYKFEITSLREDVSTDGRHAQVKFSQDWKKDASRRDFTINAIYSDKEGNLFDPFNGKEDLKNGIVKLEKRKNSSLVMGKRAWSVLFSLFLCPMMEMYFVSCILAAMLPDTCSGRSVGVGKMIR